MSILEKRRLFGIYPTKGSIRASSDVDFAIIDPKLKVRIKAEELHSKSRLASFCGWMMIGYRIHPVLGGNIVMQ